MIVIQQDLLESKRTQEELNVMGRVDVITGTLGKALGGGSGGFTSGKKEIIEILRQKSRPYLFSNTLAPVIVGASIKAINLPQMTIHILKFKIILNTSEIKFIKLDLWL